LSEALCRSCPISAARVLHRSHAGIVAVPSQTVRDGHVMVVSARHAASFSDLQPVEAGAFMAFVAGAVRAAEQASGGAHYYVLRIGDKSPHLHFHLVPVVDGDPPLAPFVFGEHGWGADARAGGVPAPVSFEAAFSEALSRERG
jgi:diadenosine tetraphosphate (Ap4A) HIT family hydrolase